MKAIICTQCGARIENVSETSLIVDCSYCRARILLETEKPAIQPPAAAPDFDPPVSAAPPLKVILLVVGFVILVPTITAVGILMSNRKSTPAKVYSAPATPSAYPTPSSWSVTTDAPAKPLPQVNYQPRVSWDGPSDLQHFEEPQVDISSVSHLTTEEVKDTVFRDRIVKLRVVINTEGEIDEVETISGNPILAAAATESAKSSIFRSRPKPTTRVLTYTFRVLKD